MRGLFVALLLVLPSVAASALGPAPETPWWTRSMLDLDGDRLDDALEASLESGATLRVLVAYASMPTAREVAALEAAGARVAFAPIHFPLLVVDAHASRLRALADAPGVVLVEQNDVVRPLLKESVPLVGAPQVWQRYGATGKGVVVAVLDDGAFEKHPDLETKVVARYDASAPGSPLQRPSDVDVLAPAGTDGHGTHVAGTAVGAGGESSGVYKGVAPASRFANVKVFSGPNQTTSDLVLRGLDWTLVNAKPLGIRVAILSLGGRASDGSDALSRAVDISVDKGLVIVAAAGNAGPGARTITSPGAAEKAITVGAVDKQKRIAPFSSRGPTLDDRVKPDLVAPGVAIVSTVPPASSGAAQGILGGGRSPYYGPLSGTSMAAPHVAGAAALMLEADPTLSPIDVKRILLVTAQDVGTPGVDNETGYGFLNAAAAVQVAKDPRLLEQPSFRARLATIPDPPPESVLDRLAYEAQAFARAPSLALAALGAAVALAIIVMVARVARR